MPATRRGGRQFASQSLEQAATLSRLMDKQACTMVVTEAFWISAMLFVARGRGCEAAHWHWPLRGRRGKSDQPVAGLKASAAGFTPRARPPRVAHEEQVSGMTHLPEELTQRLLAFRAERDWAKFHNARSVAAALSVEASELVEHFS